MSRVHRLLPAAAATLLLLAVALPAGAHGGVHGEVGSRRAVVAAGLPVPPRGCYFHGVYPGGVTGEEDDVRRSDVSSYEAAAGHRVAWVYFSNNWYRSRAFPTARASWIRQRGSVPYLRLMLRASSDERRRSDPRPDRAFPLRRIVAGDFDRSLRRWADGAAAFGAPVMAEFGTEMNGFWFGWNATHNGREDGARRFRRAYRHIVDVVRARGATNVSWVFHVNADDAPAKPWNRLERYYPGDRYVDWLAASVYGAQTPQERWNEPFARGMERVYPRLRALAPKPVLVAEFGVTKGNPRVDPVGWARRALRQILADRWPRVRGFAWWNETWRNDGVRAHDSNLRIQDIPGLPAVFATELDRPDVLTRPDTPCPR